MTRFRSRHSVEELSVQIDRFNAERQRIRAGEADPGSLERNRLEIARAQWELSYALIDRFRPST
ncbi:MAG: hypothetical protein ABR569_08305 [Gaiellaceae bacterium]